MEDVIFDQLAERNQLRMLPSPIAPRNAVPARQVQAQPISSIQSTAKTTLSSQTQGPQSSSDQSGNLATIQDQRTTVLTHIVNLDRMLRDLAAGELRETAKQEDEKKAKEQREKEHLKVLSLLAQRVDGVRKSVVKSLRTETVVGVSRGQDEIALEDWLKKTRDHWHPAAIAVDRPGSTQPPTPSSVVHHEMAVSQAASTRPSSAPASTKVDVFTQVDSTESGSLCVSGSKATPSPSLLSRSMGPDRFIVERISHSMNDIDMEGSSASLPSPSKGTKVIQDSHQADVTFLIQPIVESCAGDTSQNSQPDNFSPPSLVNIVPTTELAPSTPARTEPIGKHSDRGNKRPGIRSGSKSPLADRPVFSLSPVDWGRVRASSSSPLSSSITLSTSPFSFGDGSSRGAGVPSTPSKSYTLPPLPEGTIAALRKEVLMDPYPYPVQLGSGDGVGLRTTVAGVVESSVEATGRMPSPKSRSNVGDDDSPGEPRSLKIDDIPPLESRPSVSLPTGQATSQSNAQPVAQNATKSTKSSSMAALQKSVSMSTESLLTSTPNVEYSDTHNSSASTAAPPPEQTAVQTSIAIPPDQISDFMEDVRALITLDASPFSVDDFPTIADGFTSRPRCDAGNVTFSKPTQNQSVGRSHNLGALKKLQELYRERQMKVLNNQEENPATTSSAATSATQNGAYNDGDDVPPRNDNSDSQPPLPPLFTSPGGSLPEVTTGSRADPRPPETRNETTFPDFSIHKMLAPMLENGDRMLTSTLEPTRSLVGSEKGKDNNPVPLPSKPPKVSLLGAQKKGQPSKSKTQNKKRKVEVEDEEEQPPLKRVKPQKKAASSKKDKVPSSAVKPKSVSVASTVEKPTKHLRESSTASVVGPRIDKPVSDKFIECSTCRRSYHKDHVRTDSHLHDPLLWIFQCLPCAAKCIPSRHLPFCQNIYHSFHVPGKVILVTRRRGSRVYPSDESLHDRSVLLMTQGIKTEATFVIKSFVGMVGGEGVKVVYPVKLLG